MKFSPGEGHPEQEYPAEGLNAKHAKAKAAYALLSSTFGPDQSKKQVREITSIKQIKPHNRRKELDPEFPPHVLERGNRNPEELPDLNLEVTVIIFSNDINDHFQKSYFCDVRLKTRLNKWSLF